MNPLEFVFKRIDKLELKLDVYLPVDAAPEKPASACVWWHGGGLFQGTRKRIPPHLLRLPDVGIALISPDYRLAPQADIYSILEDAVSAVDYVRNESGVVLGDTINPNRLAIAGGSAGGWLALLVGLSSGVTGSLTSPPTYIAALYPMVDIDTPFYGTPQRPSPWMKDLIPLSAVAEHIDPKGPVIASSTKQEARALVCDYVTQEAIWHDLWFANSANRENFSVTPRVHAAAGKGACPPVWIATGSTGLCIDPAGVGDMVRVMKGYGMEVEWEEREGLGHSFDFDTTERVEGLKLFLERHLL